MKTDLHIQFRVPLDFKPLVDARAKELGMGLSQYVRQLIAADLGVEPPPFGRGAPRKRPSLVKRKPGRPKKPKPPKVPLPRGRQRKAVQWNAQQSVQRASVES